jgi:hypothetical protein
MWKLENTRGYKQVREITCVKIKLNVAASQSFSSLILSNGDRACCCVYLSTHKELINILK